MQQNRQLANIRIKYIVACKSGVKAKIDNGRSEIGASMGTMHQSSLEQAGHERRGNQHLILTSSAPLEGHQAIERDTMTVRNIHTLKVLQVVQASDTRVGDLACDDGDGDGDGDGGGGGEIERHE